MAELVKGRLGTMTPSEKEDFERLLEERLREKARMIPTPKEEGLEEGDLSDYAMPVKSSVKKMAANMPMAKKVANEVLEGLVPKLKGSNPMAGKVKGIGGVYNYARGNKELIKKLEEESMQAAADQDYTKYKEILEKLRIEKSPKKTK